MKINDNYSNLVESYLFLTVANKVEAYKKAHPAADVIKLGIGDVTLPLPQVCVDAMKTACDEMGVKETFRGYGPYEGFAFLREAIASYYQSKGTVISADEIFVSDGAKSDIGNVLDIFSRDNTVLVPDPVYPVYVDTNVMDGRTILYAKASKEDGFLPKPDPTQKADIIYLCSPNNPTGAVYDRAGLKAWVDYANANDAVILFDAAYEAFVSQPGIPHSILSVEGARHCAIEFGTFSKLAGFTGTRCGYVVIPKELERGGKQIASMWLRRQSSKYNGTSYIIQRGAAAVFTPEGQKQTKANIDYYMQNARLLADLCDRLGIWHTGGINSPYIWLECPKGMKSWDFFDFLLEKANVVGTPGSGFGTMGEGYFRLTAFGSRESTEEAAKRIESILK